MTARPAASRGRGRGRRRRELGGAGCAGARAGGRGAQPLAVAGHRAARGAGLAAVVLALSGAGTVAACVAVLADPGGAAEAAVSTATAARAAPRRRAR